MAKTREGLTLILIILGALFAVSGLVFILQGMGIVGPDTGFMFRNNTWIYRGAFILAGGLILIGIGAAYRLKPKQVAATAMQPERNPSP